MQSSSLYNVFESNYSTSDACSKAVLLGNIICQERKVSTSTTGLRNVPSRTCPPLIEAFEIPLMCLEHFVSQKQPAAD
jgi:hypothetical protein